MGLDSTGSSPVFPIISQNSYSHLLNRLQITALQKQLFFDIRLTRKTKLLVTLLVKLNVVRRFHKISYLEYRVFPAYTQFRKFMRPMQTYTRTNSRHIFKLNSIRILNQNTPNSYYILETSKGLMTHKDALREGVGGILLLKIL